MIGTVKWFSKSRGYGFIARHDRGPDVFVHISAVKNAGMEILNQGQQVVFELETNRQGRISATNLQVWP